MTCGFPCGVVRASEVSVGEVSIREIRVPEVDTSRIVRKLRVGEIGTPKIRVGEVGVGEISIREISLPEDDTSEIVWKWRVGEIGILKIRVGEVGTPEVGSVQICSSKVSAIESRPTQTTPYKRDTKIEFCVTQHRSIEIPCSGITLLDGRHKYVCTCAGVPPTPFVVPHLTAATGRVHSRSPLLYVVVLLLVSCICGQQFEPTPMLR